MRVEIRGFGLALDGPESLPEGVRLPVVAGVEEIDAEEKVVVLRRLEL